MREKEYWKRNKAGLIIRVFAAKKEQVTERVEMTLQTIKRALAITAFDASVFSRVDVLVWADRSFPDLDCGYTFKALNAALKKIHDTGRGRVFTHEFRHGDLYCAILNCGAAVQLRAGMEWSFIISSEALGYMTNKTFAEITRACSTKNVHAVGVAINELAPSIQEGRVANTFAAWRLLPLVTVGGFDLAAALPRDVGEAVCIRGSDPNQLGTKDVRYTRAGVEEIIPLCHLVRLHGPCIAPVKPAGHGQAGYKVPDPKKDPEGYRRHSQKMRSKEIRQRALALAAGYDLSYLKGGVIRCSKSS